MTPRRNERDSRTECVRLSRSWDGSGVERGQLARGGGELRNVHLDLGKGLLAPLEVESCDALLQVLDQAAQLLDRGGDRLIAAHRRVRHARDRLDVLADVRRGGGLLFAGRADLLD